MNKRYLFNLLAILVSLGLMVFTGCEEVDDNEVSAEDSTSAIAKADSATLLMETMMDNVFNSEPDSVQDMIDLLDFSEPYALYSEAATLDPGNGDANFGMAFTGFLMLSQDQDLQDMLLRWEDYFSVNEPFLVSDGSMLGKHGYGLPLSIDGIGIPVLPYIEMPVSLAKMSTGDVPQFSEFQDLVETLFLPIVEESIAALELVDDDPDFTFTISPTMQGESEATPLELDLTEIYVLQAGLYALKGVLKTVVAYNFDFVSHDSAGIVTELSQGSDFATLKANGSTDLGLAYTSANTAFERVFSALDFLEAEVDDQSDDIITNDEQEYDIDEIRSDLEDAQAVLQGPHTIHFSYWEDVYDNDGYWIDEIEVEDSLTLDISQFFNDPIQDFKAMLPPYTMSTQNYYDYERYSENVHVVVEESAVAVTGLNDTYVMVTFRLLTYDEVPSIYAYVQIGIYSWDLATQTPTGVPQGVWDLYNDFLAVVDDYSGDEYAYQYISFEWSGNVTTGAALRIEGDYYIEYDFATATYVEPYPSWNAGSYAEWLAAWPDPTMNGIFPGMDAQRLADLLDFDEEDWNQMSN